MEEAERIAREEHGSIKLAVISGRLSYVCALGLVLTLRAHEVWAREIIIED
jgi:hypothetical protein